MLNIRTDLACEAHESAPRNKDNGVDGVIYDEYTMGDARITRIQILDESGEKSTGKPIGKYISTQLERDFQPKTMKELAETISSQIKELLGEVNGCTLVAGLGNRYITADAIGPKALSHLIVTRHIKSMCPGLYDELSLNDIAALAPGVLAQTGIESCDIIKSVVSAINPSLLIVIDALASRSLSHLACVIQLSDYGIAPGSGVNNARNAINRETIGIPVISIGVPTVVDASTFATDLAENLGADPEKKQKMLEGDDFNCFITLKETDTTTDNISKLIGYSLNLAIHKNLSYDEMISICS